MHAYLPLLSLVAIAQLGAVSASFRRRQDETVINIEGEDEEEPPLELPEETESLIAMQFTDDPHAGRDHMEMIQNGELGLSGIIYAPKSFTASGGSDYTEVYGEFCAFDSALNKADPAHYPTIDAVMSQSEHCDEHSYTIPLREVMEAVSATDGSSNKMKRLPVTGLLFHIGYSGAGLVSNALATFESAHVVSEHTAIRDALSACDIIRNRYLSEDCSPEKQSMLLRDVVTLLSRVPATSPARHLYLKAPSMSAAHLNELRSLYPEAKWAFVYRKAEDALAKATMRNRDTVCVKSRRNPSAALIAKARERGLDLEALSPHDLCAMHLATLLEAAVREHEASGTGMLISYDKDILSNVDAMVNVILPYLGLGEDIVANPEVARERVAAILSMRSDTSMLREPEDQRWNEGGESIEITEEVRAASQAHMGELMGRV